MPSFKIECFQAVWLAEYGGMDGGARGYWDSTMSSVEFGSEAEAKAYIEANPVTKVHPGAGNFGMSRVRKELRPIGEVA